MQRSRKALVQRRALKEAICGRSRLYKVSLSVVVVLWGLVFFLNTWIGHGDAGWSMISFFNQLNRIFQQTFYIDSILI